MTERNEIRIFKERNHMTVPKNLNSRYDYNANRDVFLQALGSLCSDSELNQYSAQDVVDAVLSIDLSSVPVTVSAIEEKARENIESNTYHPQYKSASFAINALYDYADKTSKSLREAYRDMLTLDMFTTLHDHYYILHTQTFNAAGLFVQRRSETCFAVRDEYALPVAVSDVEERLVEMMPDSTGYDWNNVGTHISGTTKEIVKEYGTVFSDEVLAILVMRHLVDGDPIQEAIDTLPTEELLHERQFRARRIFDAFANAREKDKDISFHDWFFDASVSGLFPLLTVTDAAKERERIEQAIEDNHEKKNELRAEFDAE